VENLNYKIRLSILITIYLISIVWAQQISEADMHYVSAQNYLNNDDYKNALRSIHLARMIYLNQSNTGAVSHCDNFIKTVTTKTTPPLKARYYYEISEDYYFEAEESKSIELYSYSVYYAKQAKEDYDRLGDSRNIERCQDLISSAQGEINRYFSEEKIKAGQYYTIARDYFIEDQYLIALSYAENASTIYALIPDAEGIERSRILIEKIEEEIEGVIRNAQSACDTSMNLYNEGNISGAEFYATKCKILYQTVDFSPGLTRANDLLQLINDYVYKTVQTRKNNADRLYKQAKDSFIRELYSNATFTIWEARKLYEELYYETPDSDKTMKQYYYNFLGDCDRLYLEIRDAWRDDRMKTQADQFFAQAIEYYRDQFFDEALSYAQKSKALCEDLQDYVCVSTSDALIKNIIDRTLREFTGDGNLTKASEFLSKADFDNALIHATRAKTIYSTLIGSNKSLSADELLGQINANLVLKEEASKQFNLAYEQFNAGNFEVSMNAAQEANRIYNEIGYSIGIEESKEILEKATSEFNKEKSKQRTIMLSILVVVVVVVILFLNYRKKEKAVETAARVAEDERKKRDDMEKKKWEVKKEVEAEKLAEEKFKGIITEERDLVGKEPTTEGSISPPVSEDIEEDVL